MSRKRKSGLEQFCAEMARWMRKHPLATSTFACAALAAYWLGHPAGLLGGLLIPVGYYVLSTWWRRVNDRSTLHRKPTNVYAFRDAAGVLIYIGIAESGRQLKRWAEHQADKYWWTKVASAEVLYTYPDRYKALTREALLIRKLRPEHNIMHNRIQGWRVYLQPSYWLRWGIYRDPRRRQDARETAAVLSARYRCELWAYEITKKWQSKHAQKPAEKLKVRYQ